MGALIELGVPAAAVRAACPPLMLSLMMMGLLVISLQMLLTTELAGFEIRFDRRDGAASGLGFVESLGPAWFLYWRTAALLAAPLWFGNVLIGAYYEPALGLAMTAILGASGCFALVTAGLSVTLRSLFLKRFRIGRFVVCRSVQKEAIG